MRKSYNRINPQQSCKHIESVKQRSGLRGVTKVLDQHVGNFKETANQLQRIARFLDMADKEGFTIQDIIRMGDALAGVT